MSSPRLWVLILFAVAFLAGGGAGFVLAERARGEVATPTPFGEFERAFVQEFELDPERQRLLAGLLDHYNREAQAVGDRYAADFRASKEGAGMELELQSAGLEYRGLIRDQLLPDDQRPKFDRLMATYVENL